MIDDDAFLEMLHKHYPGHSFRITEHDRGRSIYVDNSLVKIGWLKPSEIIESDYPPEAIAEIDKIIIDAILSEVNIVISKKLEEKANEEIPDLHLCLCG
jgi:hypothetical protein